MSDRVSELFAVVGFVLAVIMNGYVVVASFLGWPDWDIGPFHYLLFRIEIILILAAFVGIGLSRIKNGQPPFFDQP